MRHYNDELTPSDILKGLAFIFATGFFLGAIEPSADEDNFLAAVFLLPPLLWYVLSDFFTNDKE